MIRSALSYFLYSGEGYSGRAGAFLYYSTLLYIISLFIKDAPVITNIIAGILLLAAFITTPPSSYLTRLRASPVALGLILFFLLNVVSVLLSDNKAAGMAVLQMRLPLFILPLAIALVAFSERVWDKILLFYAFAVTVASLVGFFHGAYMAQLTHDSGYLYNDNICWIIDKQAVYFAFYVNVAILIFIQQLLGKDKLTYGLRRMIYFAVPWLMFIVVMLASKTAMISLVIILVVLIYVLLFRNRKIFEGVLLTLSIVIGSFLIVKMFPKVANRFEGLMETSFQFDNRNMENHFNAEYDESKWNSTNTRAALWICAMEIFYSNPVLGTGVGDRNDVLMEKYREKDFIYAYTTQKHTHNQYLDAAVSMGAVGLVAFLWCFVIFPLIYFSRKKYMLGICVSVALAISFLTENMLDRYMGEILIAFILPVIAAARKQQALDIVPGSPAGTC